MLTALYVGFIAIGVFGLVMTGAFPTQKTLASLQALNASQNELITALNHKADAFGKLNDALERKAAAAENLADEREKTLALYRSMEQRVVPFTGTFDRFSHTPDSPGQTFGMPAEKLGGGKGN